MSDIIKDAKQLLDGATPGKWRAADSDIIAEDINRFIATVSEYSGLDEPSEEYANVQLIAAAPELAQALAEETWEYTYHIKRQGEWEPTRNMETRREDWWDDRLEVVETVELLRASGFEARIVRRRVSPPEVINE